MRDPVANTKSPQKMLWHNRLRRPVNSGNQKLDDMHVACVPNSNEKEENTPNTSNMHWHRMQVHI